MSSISIRLVRRDDEVEDVRRLLSEYREWLQEHSLAAGVTPSVVAEGAERFAAEIHGLPGDYGPPGGALVLARENETPIGCAALRRVDSASAELKRLYVRTSYRRLQLGEGLTQALLEVAGRLGYSRVVLDTMPTMTAAIALYRKMGFVSIPAYWPNPLQGALFFEYLLRM